MRHAAYFLVALAACDQPSPSPPPAQASTASPSVSARASISAVPSVSAAPSASTPTFSTPEARAAWLHKSAIVVDGHNDITSAILERGFDLAKPTGNAMTDLARMKAGGITGEFFSIYVDRSFAERPNHLRGGSARRALDMIDITYQQIERHPDALVLATSSEDIRRAKTDGKIAVLMGIEGGHAIENSLFALRDMLRLGVRYMTLTHTNTNDWADSAGFVEAAPRTHHGLSPFGEEVVREMQRIGMLVDVSHVSDETFTAVMRVAVAPVIASHSSARALRDHRRNLSDDMLRALAKNGGVAMVNFFADFLDPAYGKAQAQFFATNKEKLEELKTKYKDEPGKLYPAMEALLAESHLPEVTVAKLCDHIDHMVKIAGEDHVGLGSDFDGVPTMPKGLEGIDGLPKITLELVKRGYSDETIKKILGENFLRVFSEVTAHARATKTTLSGDGSTKKIPGD